jgi:4-amino-4-deoxy-L-arabinose transferase-like glycosyltransferase
MDRYRALSRGTQVMFVAAVLLLIVTFLDWQKVSAKIGGVEIASVTLNAWHGFWGVLMGLLIIALVAWLIASMAGVTMQLPVSDMLLSAALGVAILVCAVLKGLTDEFSTVWAWIGVALAGVIALGAYLRVQESGGMDKLRAEASDLTSSRDETPPPAPPQEPPPA